MSEFGNVMSEDLRTSADGQRDIVAVPDVKLDDRQSLNSRGLPVPDHDSALIGEISICQDFSQFLSLNGTAHRSLSKCKTFPISKDTHADSLSTNGKAGHGQEPSGSGASAYSRSLSLQSSSTVVSAMKGGRTLNGAMVKGELRVKWAPEVYDPLSTSMSHTVKSHQQRPKPKKKDKYKHKGKLPRGSGSERKHGNRKTLYKTADPPNASLRWLILWNTALIVRKQNVEAAY